MSRVRFNKIATPSNPAANKAELFYSSSLTPVSLAAVDESGNIARLAGFSTKDYRLIKVVHVLQGTTTYTPTSGTAALFVEAVGAGGQGGGAATGSANCSLGSGGGGGAYSSLWVPPASFKSSYAVVVGAGGSTGAAGATGQVGADTTFDSPSICTAKGGAGGTVLAAGVTLVTQAGVAGGAAASGVGDDKMAGGPGHWGVRMAATTGQSGDGGQGAGAIGGGGGLSVNTTVTVGGAGGLYGGGGAGSFTATTSQVGGAGANGLLRIWEFA